MGMISFQKAYRLLRLAGVEGAAAADRHQEQVDTAHLLDFIRRRDVAEASQVADAQVLRLDDVGGILERSRSVGCGVGGDAGDEHVGALVLAGPPGDEPRAADGG
jgi:hypothetical protein